MWLCNPGTRGPVHFPVPRVFPAIPPRVASAPRGGAGTELGRNPRPSEFGAHPRVPLKHFRSQRAAANAARASSFSGPEQTIIQLNKLKSVKQTRS